jgi:hypothetical protein
MRPGICGTVAGAAALTLTLSAWCEPSSASELTDALKGEWSGSGEIALANGKVERIRCRGESREVSENAVEQFFHCASTDKEFDFSTSMHFSEGRARGNWSAPDRSGTLTGSASPDSLQLRLSSASGEGNLSATIGSCSQSIDVTGWSDDLKSLSAELRKDC